jgi:hypothetical protein
LRINPSEICVASVESTSRLTIENTRIAANNVVESVTKNWITVIPSDLLSDLPLKSMMIPVSRRKEFTPHLVHIIIAARLFCVMVNTSPSDINAPAIGDQDMVISVIK